MIEAVLDTAVVVDAPLTLLDNDDITGFTDVVPVVPLVPVLLFCMLHRLVPLDKKLPNEIDPFGLMKGVVRCC